MRYDCAGAGQRTLSLFDNRSWQDHPPLLRPQMDTFRHLRTIHDLLGLLATAQELALPARVEARRQELVTALCPENMTPARAKRLATGSLPEDVRDFLKSLARHAGRARA
ncbi:hypothetical protein [Marimonas arenosa]|uniref:Uncharacterized protein n=1 Tax=Marimonas arenosa TaxID=1795305 RepID=A0AAE4B2Q7_9RHOB|nr:hypothetical protein [Marimonas arenosa]MDQ2088522.1 hypothetical protein [Marimonas arenosa]